jgi:putative toxin-antitoxin system antitoxin component (TIGR02293 family)
MIYIGFISYLEPAMARAAANRKRRKSAPSGLSEEERPFVHDEIVRGIPARRVKVLIDRGALGAGQVFRVIPQRTFNRRLASGEPLKPEEADAVGRILRITTLANRTFSGDAKFARDFLSLPNPSLDNRIPFELVETEAGARDVEALLLRIAHGVYS